MKAAIKYILFIILALSLAFIVPMIIRYFHTETNNETEYKKLQHERDSLKSINVYLTVKIDSIQVLADSMIEKVSENKERIIYIKQKANEKYTAIGNYSTNELYLYFAGIKTEAHSGQ